MRYDDYIQEVKMYKDEAQKTGLTSQTLNRLYVRIVRKNNPETSYRIIKDPHGNSEYNNGIGLSYLLHRAPEMAFYRNYKVITTDKMPDTDDYFIFDNSPYTAVVIFDKITAIEALGKISNYVFNSHATAISSTQEMRKKHYLFEGDKPDAFVNIIYPNRIYDVQTIMTMDELAYQNEARRHYGELEFNIPDGSIDDSKLANALFIRDTTDTIYKGDALKEYRSRAISDLITLINDAINIPYEDYSIIHIDEPFKEEIQAPFNVVQRNTQGS